MKQLTHKKKVELSKYLDPLFPSRYDAPTFKRGQRVRFKETDDSRRWTTGTVRSCTQRSHFLEKDAAQLAAGFRVRGIYEVRIDRPTKALFGGTTRTLWINDEDLQRIPNGGGR